MGAELYTHDCSQIFEDKHISSHIAKRKRSNVERETNQGNQTGKGLRKFTLLFSRQSNRGPNRETGRKNLPWSEVRIVSAGDNPIEEDEVAFSF